MGHHQPTAKSALDQAVMLLFVGPSRLIDRDIWLSLKANWKARFGAAWPEIAGMGFDARFRRLWDMYLDYCRAGFTAGTIDVRHVRLARA